jgi:hypothetical protein
MVAVAADLASLPGARHVMVAPTGEGRSDLVTADIRAAAADDAFRILGRHGVPADDVVLSRLDTISIVPNEDEPLALVWADILSRARTSARAPGRYLVLMAAAGVVAAFAVINKSPVLIVGAMAISPDLLPITAASRAARLALGPGLPRVEPGAPAAAEPTPLVLIKQARIRIPRRRVERPDLVLAHRTRILRSVGRSRRRDGRLGSVRV